jgi:hypothetical protein
MARSVSIKFSQDINALIAKSQATAADNGAQFIGDTNSGRFSGNGVVGTYTISSNTVKVIITDKPWYAPWSMVESKITDFFK